MNNFLNIDTIYKPEEGSFGKCKFIKNERFVIEQWFYCRDIFHKHEKKMNLFFFVNKKGKENNVFNFIKDFESVMNIPESEMGLTQRKNIIWFKPSKWWLKNIRKYLFTILVRCGCNYKNNIQTALFSSNHLLKTEYALNKFMQGYTICLTKKKGWCRQFKNLTNEEIDKILIKDDFPK